MDRRQHPADSRAVRADQHLDAVRPLQQRRQRITPPSPPSLATRPSTLRALICLPRRPIYDNGLFVTHEHGGLAGLDASAGRGPPLQLGVMGYASDTSAGHRLVDEFFLTGPATIDTVEVFADQPGAAPLAAFASIGIEI